MSVLDIGASALRTAYTRLQTTGHNIANASTPGYTRQEAQVASLGTQFEPGGFVGGGVMVESITRQYDQHLAGEVNTSSAMLSSDRVRADGLSRIDRLLSDTENGLGARFDSFNDAISDMVNKPDDMAARTVVLERAGNLAMTVNANHAELDRIGQDTNQQIDQTVVTLNDQLLDLSRLNQRIVSSAGSPQVPNDLLDQRDALVTTISESIQTHVTINENETVSVFAIDGHGLVVANDAATLSLESDPNDPRRVRLVLETPGEPVALKADSLGAGSLPGLLRFRNEDLVLAQAGLGRIAGAVADAYNRQQSLGIDMNGASGSPLFEAGKPVSLGASGNSGNAAITVEIVDGSLLQASDYVLERIAGQHVLTRTSDGNQTTLAGWPQTVDGLEFDLSAGAMVDGDVISLRTASAFSGNFELAMTSPMQWANAYAALPVMSVQNTGSLTVGDFSVVAQDANVSEPVTLVFGAGNTVTVTGTGTGNPGSISWQEGVPISFNGWELTLNGQPTVGDELVVSPPSNSRADNRNASRLLSISRENVVGEGSPIQAIGALIGEVGERSLTATRNVEQADAWYQGALAQKDRLTGVNLDEEAARLLQFQQAYQAAAKVISASQTMFDSLMSVTR